MLKLDFLDNSPPSRIQLALDILADAPPSDSMKADHKKIATAILEGMDYTSILAMPETLSWPDTHAWIRRSFLDFAIIFDNGGGTTLQSIDFCHFYDSAPHQAAIDAYDLLRNVDPLHWNGNQPEHRMAYDYATEQNGGCLWIYRADLDPMVWPAFAARNNHWFNVVQFFERWSRLTA